MIAIAAVVALAMLAGVTARRQTARTDLVVVRLLDFVLYVLLPLISFAFATRLTFDLATVLGITIGYLSLAIGGLIAWWFATRLLHLGRLATGSLVLAVVMANTGYLGLPVAATLLGRDELPNAVAWDQLITNPISVVLAPFIAAAFSGHGGENSFPRQLLLILRRAPAIVALAIGLLVPQTWVAQWVLDVATACVYLTLPLGFFAVGATVQKLRGEGGRPRHRTVGVAVVLRLAAVPAIVGALLLAVPDAPRAFMLQAAMPSGVNSLVVAHAFGLDRGLSATAIMWSTIVAMTVALGAVVVL